MTPIPHGAAARALPPCDLVMKGGVTSGIVYPSLVLKLAEHYRFASIGGTSAGAIAAALSAASEYGRQRDNGGGTDRLEAALKSLAEPHAIVGLFQPTPATKPLFEVITKALLAKKTRWRRIAFVAGVAAQRRARAVVVGALLLAALVASGVVAFVNFSAVLALAWTIVVVAPLILLVIVATAVAAVGGLLLQTVRALGDSDFGMCPGTRQRGGDGDAVVEWLHEHIQSCAGKPLDEPLTFRDLADEGIDLTMITTDLSLARPVRVPHALDAYRFDVEKMRERFPAVVVDAMLDGESPARARFQKMPTEDLPVLVGVRLSLSFPLLLSAMPLYQESALEALRPNLFSDGGISSNFPMHFFDAWFPRRPTFGIDLADFPEGDKRDVFMLPNPLEPAIPRWGVVDSLPGFLSHIKDTAQNWRDTLQSELPGSRDRVCQIRFGKGQGGLYLDMDAATIADLVRRGHMAGETILATFDAHQWDQHRWVRYLTLMGLLEDNLHRAGPPFGAFAPELARGLPNVEVYRGGHDAQWCLQAQHATAALLALAGGWGASPGDVDFRTGEVPVPDPVMRAVPRA
jgi:predicted acylesterase/phospholipase RssA